MNENKVDEKKPRVIVVMPAYNAAKTLLPTYLDIPQEVVDHIILVDDVSQDETVEIARRLPMKVVPHLQNKGYGGNQKTCYIEALKAGGDVIVMLHPDHQYDSRLIPELIDPILQGNADLVLGSRMLDGKALEGGMPLYKYISNRFLTFLENLVFRKHLSEYHTGMRAYSRRFIKTVPFLLNSDNFVFDTEIIAQAVALGFPIVETPVPARYFPEASSVNFWVSLRYGLSTLWVLIRYLLHRWRLVRRPQFHRTLSEITSPYHWQEINSVESKDHAQS